MIIFFDNLPSIFLVKSKKKIFEVTYKIDERKITSYTKPFARLKHQKKPITIKMNKIPK